MKSKINELTQAICFKYYPSHLLQILSKLNSEYLWYKGERPQEKSIRKGNKLFIYLFFDRKRQRNILIEKRSTREG